MTKINGGAPFVEFRGISQLKQSFVPDSAIRVGERGLGLFREWSVASLSGGSVCMCWIQLVEIPSTCRWIYCVWLGSGKSPGWQGVASGGTHVLHAITRSKHNAFESNARCGSQALCKALLVQPKFLTEPADWVNLPRACVGSSLKQDHAGRPYAYASESYG